LVNFPSNALLMPEDFTGLSEDAVGVESKVNASCFATKVV